MKKITDQDPESKSRDIVSENIEQLKVIFPEAFTEDKIDFEALKQLLGGAVNEREEKYGLNWHGKRSARLIALTPSTGTLRPRPEDSVDWDITQNLMIEGDNLEVLKLLQKSYAGKIKMIYIDPPYNTGGEFVYPDDFKDNMKNYLIRTGQVESDGRVNSTNTEASGRFHTDWLNMMYPRLKLARSLLRKDGLLFVSIDDGELDNLCKVLNEIFGEENFLVRLVWKSKSGGANDSETFAVDHEYIVVYCSSIDQVSINLDPEAQVTTSYNRNDAQGSYALDRLDKQSIRYSKAFDYVITGPDGTEYRPAHKNPAKPNASWRWSKDTVKQRYDELVFENGCVYTKNYKSKGAVPRSLLVDERFGRTRTGKTQVYELMQEDVFDNPKPTKLLSHLLRISTSSNDIVLDFFAGSGTTGHAVMSQNAGDNGTRRFILVQFPEITEHDDFPTIAEICKERLRRAGKKIREENPMFTGDIGFRVFKLDYSNIRAWEPDRENLAATLEEHAEHLKVDRTEQDILYELLLKLGLDLTVPIQQKTIAGKTVHSIGAGTLLVCLATEISTAQVEPLALGIIDWYKQLAPAGETQVVFRDSAFADDVAKTNLTAILQQYGLENVRSI
ncbi:Type III restriction-modification system methylation subunit [Dehalococcoides mccartyi]|uniref:site-specific DNA-methyltransferase n=1 Tax=Dehalococcoides mccartyi TaxID=61435 RepID=UPI000CDEB4AE|nr:site-specific DNA-methyltransferase [Dehalococcoides mccartyi]POZ59252.1 Type III restriction-modification system methylation subunit [Dehalococcoides mccartyi]